MNWFTPVAPQPVDLHARARAAQLIRDFLSGVMDSDALEDDWPRDSADPAIDALRNFVWHFYEDDVDAHRFNGPPEAARALARCAEFLDSELPYEWRPPPLPLRLLAAVTSLLTFGAAARLWRAPTEWPFPPRPTI